MADWNPSLYLQFGAERTRPAAELLARIAHHPVALAVDLGCGPGNSTALLRHAWPEATIIGVDNSPAMLEEAAQRLPDCRFVEGDIAGFRPERPADVIYANASLQWLTDHQRQEPSHVLMREVAEELGYPASGRPPLPDVPEYYDMLTACGCEVDIWRTTYFHPLASHQAIIEWLQSTGLRPFLQPLDEPQRQAFLERYLARLKQHYPLQCNGKVLLLFPRLFIVARR